MLTPDLSEMEIIHFHVEMTADNLQIHEQLIIFCLNQIYWKFEIIADKIF